jgi:hypothetical protein
VNVKGLREWLGMRLDNTVKGGGKEMLTMTMISD